MNPHSDKIITERFSNLKTMIATIQIQNSTQFMEYVQTIVPTVSGIKEALKVADRLIPNQEIAALNLEPIIVKIKLEEDWEVSKILKNYLFYKQFLYLSKSNEDVKIIPTKEVDEFWHFHIQDTRKYAEDCQIFLGRMLHHFPYFGLRSKEDAQTALIAQQKTREILEKTFGIPAWKGSEAVICSTDCKDCIADVTIEGLEEERPTLETIGWA